MNRHLSTSTVSRHKSSPPSSLFNELPLSPLAYPCHPLSIPCSCPDRPALARSNFPEPYPHQSSCPTGKRQAELCYAAWRNIRDPEILAQNFNRAKDNPNSHFWATAIGEPTISSHGHLGPRAGSQSSTQTCVETAQQCIDNCKDAGITMAQYLLNRAGYVPRPDTMARLTAVKSSRDAWSTHEDTGYVMEQLDPVALGLGEEGPWSFEDPPLGPSIAGFPAPISCYHRLANSPSAPKSFASNLAQSYKLKDDEKKRRLSMLFLDTKDYSICRHLYCVNLITPILIGHGTRCNSALPKAGEHLLRLGIESVSWRQ